MSCARQAETKLRPQALPVLEFLGEWGTKGVGPDQLQQPMGLATDASGSVYVADAGSGFIHKFSLAGEPLLAFDDPALPTPRAIAVDGGGGIYASDWNNHRVLVFAPNGDRLREQRRGGGASFRLVSGMAVDGEGNLFAVDATARLVLKFDARGRFRKAWGSAGKRDDPSVFQSPTAIAVGTDGTVYVVDEGKARIVMFTSDGRLVSAWGGGLGSDGLQGPAAIAVNDKYAFVSDSGAVIRVLSLDGKVVHSEDLSTRVKPAVPGKSPAALALAGRDELLVLDSAAARVLRFRINL